MVSGVLFQGWNIGTLGNTLNGCVTQNHRVARCLKRIMLSPPPPPNSSSCQDSDRLVYDSGSLSPSICWMLVCLYPPAVRDSLFVTIVQQRGSADFGLFAIGTALQATSGLSCDLQQVNLGKTSMETLTRDTDTLLNHDFWEEKQMKTYRNNSLLCMLFASRV